MENAFGHEGLDCYKLAREVARWAARQHIPTARKHLRDQLVRSADSVVLNIAEGGGRDPGAARRNHYRMAKGSAAEVCSILDLIDLPQGPQRQVELRRIGAMLSKLAKT